MKKELTTTALDAELTLSDGTPVRLALPGPSAPKRRARWPWVVLAGVMGYVGWFSQQPWLFVQGPTIVANHAPGLEPVICQRVLEHLQPDIQEPWLPPLGEVQRTGRCMNDQLRLDTLTAQALRFLGAPIQPLRLEAIQTQAGWQLQSQLGGLSQQAQIEPADTIELITPLRQLALDVLDPLIAAQRHIVRDAPELALAALSRREGPTADLTRAHALRQLGRYDEAWRLYERYPHQPLAQVGMADLAWLTDQPDVARQLLINATQAPLELRVDLALKMDEPDWAESWLALLLETQGLALRARLLHAQSQYLQAIQAYGKVPAEQLTDNDRIRWAEALERTGQYPRAEQLLAELPEDQAAFALAKLNFHRGQVDAALNAMAPLQQPDAQLQLVEWLIWDGQYNKAKTHFHRLPIGDRTDHLKALWHLHQGDATAAREQAQSIQDPVEKVWMQGLIAVATENRAMMRQAFDQLSQSDVERANWLGAYLNFTAGHAEAAQASLSKVGSNKVLALHRAWLADQLGERGVNRLSQGEQSLFFLAQERVRLRMSAGRYDQASTLAKAYLALRDNDPRMAKWLALSYQAQGYDQAALDAYLQVAKAGRLDSNLTTQAAILAEQLQAWPAVAELLAPTANTLASQDLNRLLNAWVKQGQYERAEEWIRTAIVKSSQDPTLYVRWGQLLLGSGDSTGALSKFRQAIKLDPGSIEGLIYLAKTLTDNGQAQEAVVFARQASQQSLRPELALIAADVFEAAGQSSYAANVLETVPQSLQTDAIKLRLAQLQVAEGMNYSASKTFEAVMNDEVQDAGLWRTWGDALAALGKTTEALEKYKIAVRLSR